MARVVATEAGTPARDEDRRGTPPWWTEADEAELAALTWELIDGIFEHRETCSRCIAHATRETGSLPCPNVRNAIEVVADWRYRRELLSRALWLRRQRELLEYERDLAAFRGAA